MLKANAYGHGAGVWARDGSGWASMLACPIERASLREAGVSIPILVFGR